MNLPNKGDYIRVNIWTGIVKNIYLADAGRSPMLEIEFAKNCYKNQKPEFHSWEELEPHTRVSSAEELKDEIAMLKLAQKTAWEDFERGMSLEI